jgi:hypothetical protein
MITFNKKYDKNHKQCIKTVCSFNYFCRVLFAIEHNYLLIKN